MGKVLNILGILFVAQIVFVGLIHVFLMVQGKNSPETMGSLHSLPMIGGFFFPPDAGKEKKLTPEDKRRKEAREALEDGEAFFPLPEGFDRKELSDFFVSLKEARAGYAEQKQKLAIEREALVTANSAVEAQREELLKGASELEERARNLEAQMSEVEARRNRIKQSEIKNLKAIAVIYEKISDPQQAAEKLQMLEDDDLVAKILFQMSSRASSKVLAALDTPRAVAVTRRMQALDLTNPGKKTDSGKSAEEGNGGG